MLAEVRPEYVFKTIDPPVVPEEKADLATDLCFWYVVSCVWWYSNPPLWKVRQDLRTSRPYLRHTGYGLAVYAKIQPSMVSASLGRGHGSVAVLFNIAAF